MYEFVRDLKDIYTHSQQKPYVQKKTLLSKSLSENISYFRTAFSDSTDLTVREISLSGISGAVISIDNMTDKQVLAEGILMPLFSYDFGESSVEVCYNDIKYRVLFTADMVEMTTYEEIEKYIMSGFAMIALDCFLNSSKSLTTLDP